MRHLKENSRTTFVDIGKALDISDATVYNRVKRLTEEGVITKFTIEVDMRGRGKRTRGFILMSVAPGSVKEVSKRVCEIENVHEVYEIHGSGDLIVKVEGENLRKLRPVIFKVRQIPDVVDTEFIPVFKTWKD